MQQPFPLTTDVLIVGAGPAGLTLAASLAQLGVDHLIIDRLSAVAPGSKAAGVQPRTLEYLSRLRVADVLVDDGIRGRGFAVADNDRTLLRAAYDSLDTPFPFMLLISQHQTEARLQQRLEALGGRVHRSVRLLNLQEEFPGTAATVADPDGVARVVHARYVVGCDGVYSKVRDVVGLEFPGDAPPQLFALADVRLDNWPDDDADTTFFLSQHGMLITSPLPGGQLRLVASVSPGTTAPTASDIAELIKSRGGGRIQRCRVTEVVASSTYRVQQRVASQLRCGNTFLLGDAAHTHSPAGGQGMNTGIQDAANLAWKLHHVITGRATDQLLDSYDGERRPVAAQLIAFTAQLMSAATVADPQTAELRNEVIAAAAAVPGVTDWMAVKLSQLDIGYSGAGAAPLAPGRRVNPRIAPAADLSWMLVTPDSAPTAALASKFTAVTTPDVSHPVAVRPDGIAADPNDVANLFDLDLATDLEHERTA